MWLNSQFSILNSQFMRGLVIKNTGSWYTVRTEEGSDVECKIKGNFRLKEIRTTNPVAVGDRVEIDVNAEGTAFITAIEERKNYIIRRASNLSKQAHILAANLDQAFLIVTINYPITTPIFIDRFLATAEAYRIPVKLVFNKIDAFSYLPKDADDLSPTGKINYSLNDWRKTWMAKDTPCIFISAITLFSSQPVLAIIHPNGVPL